MSLYRRGIGERALASAVKNAIGYRKSDCVRFNHASTS